MNIENFWDKLPIILLGLGQLSQSILIMRLYNRLIIMEEFPKFLLETLKEISDNQNK